MATFVTQGQEPGQVLVPASHATIDHTAGPFNLLNATAHQGVDHTAAPFNLLNATAHQGVNHKAAPFNLLDAADHALIDHALIPGAGGGPVSANVTVLEAGSTAPQINTALTNYSIVYLKPGSYGTLSAAITIPANKALIALSGGPQDGLAYGALMSWNSTSSMFSVGNGGRIEGLSITASAAGTGGLLTFSGSAWTIVKNCQISAPTWTGRIIDAQFSMLHLENIGIVDLPKTGTAPAIHWSPTAGSNEGRCSAIIRNVRVEFSVSGSGFREGILVADGAIIETCWVSSAGSHGFQLSENFRVGSVTACRATSCGGDGFKHSSPGPWLAVTGCQATGNAGIGFNFPFGISGSTLRGALIGNAANTNTGGNFTIGSGYVNVGNTAT